MTVVLDTNALIHIFGRKSFFSSILDALREGRLKLAVSTPFLLEYEKVIMRFAGPGRWQDVWTFLSLIDLLHGNVHLIGPDYRFLTITGDPDDDAFADCAIAIDADYIITSDHHFDALIGSGYKPQPITLEEFNRCFPAGC